MPQSISRAQASALSDGFFDQFGANDDVELPETNSALIRIAGALVEKAQSNLRQGGHISTGKGSDSITAREPVITGKTTRIDIEMSFYLQFMNKGVRGTRGGSGQYQFKNDKPGGAMVRSIYQWLKRAKGGVRNVKRTYGKQERKGKALSEYSNAYAVARSIKRKGIRANGFMDNAIASVDKLLQDALAEGLRIDVLNNLPNKI